MSDEQIERMVEGRVNRLDALFMAKGITQAEYDAEQRDIQEWAERRYVDCVGQTTLNPLRTTLLNCVRQPS